MRNVLTNVLGARDQVEVHMSEHSLEPGDVVLLCSDGLHGVLDDPTLAEIAREKTPEKIDGISFAPTLFGRVQTNQHDFLYWEFHEHGFQQAVRMGDWKAVRPQAGEPLELYNLKTDLAEKTNVAKEHADIVAKIENYLKTARIEDKRWPIKKPDEPDKTAKSP